MPFWKRPKDPELIDPQSSLPTDPQSIIHYVESELARAIPAGWTSKRMSRIALAWTIEKHEIGRDEWSTQDYQLFFVEGIPAFILTYGNNDIGGGGENHYIHNAKLVHSVTMTEFRLGNTLGRLFDTCKPNEWGYT